MCRGWPAPPPLGINLFSCAVIKFTLVRDHVVPTHTARAEGMPLGSGHGEWGHDWEGRVAGSEEERKKNGWGNVGEARIAKRGGSVSSGGG